ncbi:MAG: phenylacetic acid degradation bifunctional protein PaaZ [Gracilimonas sp.]|uniref:phenylacetic acid degradation bifunctional protein PaaZ n=1 Tax=Gracilimonas TaxID=649462 RepID=UPI001B125DF5|nr:phenylacetic acid degradation bifunctional protein PaaZ [Gracilimonas sp.]MBO6585371.1 phenylacetic acid degradation bifunctional protein PaaZ [Gracilimonas sp.]MBO6616367.1 phenylacetic acid degradation bifunctional protein PaaZ [Gracilimonas sp.]
MKEQETRNQIRVTSYIKGEWLNEGAETDLVSAVTNEPVAQMVEAEIDYKSALEYARTVGGPKLREMSIHERAFKIKFLGQYLMERKEKYYEISTHTGATRKDSWIDIEGGLITAFGISSKSRRELSDLPWHVEGDTERLSRKGTFMGQHICVPRHGVAVHINAFNFPVWGMLEKLAPAIIAGMPVIVKPAPTGSYLAWEVFKDMIEADILPEGSVQFIAADKPGDLLDHLISQDMVAFTGSAVTGKKLKAHPNIIANNVPFNLEADSLNCSILGEDVTPEMEEFKLFIREVSNEMTVKTGQKCTAIRRTIVPENLVDDVIEALKARLEKTTIGHPAEKETRMGPLASNLQAERFEEQLQQLSEITETVYASTGKQNGAFTNPRVLVCHKPMQVDDIHRLEAFGPMTTVMPYKNTQEAIDLANKANGSLVGSLFTADDEIAQEVALGCAPYHGRFMVINRNSAEESTGHGSPIASLVHGGPGHAGGGEELGGARAVLHNMQRVALQGSPTTLRNIVNQHIKGAETEESDKHPFQKYFEELKIGEALTTDKRTVTDKDVEEFAELSGDHFYAHTDPEAASRSLFGKIVAHGYFVLSATAGLFVDPDEGPVMLNYGLENLRFVAPVAPGDTIQAKLILKRKNVRQQKKDDPFPFGVVYWDVEVTNQENVVVAEYTILTLMKRKNKLPIDEQ